MAKLYFKIASDWEEVVRLRNEIAKLKQELKGMDATQSPAAFNALNTQLSASTQRMDELVTEAAKAGAEIDGKFKKKIFDASQTVNGLTEKIIAQKSVVKDVEADVKRLGEAYRIALKRNPLSAGSKLEEYNAARKALDEEKAALFDLTQQQAEARLSVKRLRDEYALYNDDAKEVVESNNGIAISWKKALAIIGGAGVLKALASEIIRVRGEFQSMQTAIESMVGKDMAERLIPQIKELAKISPLEFADITAATQQMLGFNIEAEKVPRFISAISDISMGEAPKFNSLTLAFSQMSATGKLMGQDLNQMINAGFNPLQIMSEKTGKSIAQLKEEMSKGAISAEMVQQAFIDATSAGGKFYNMSENASKTINGQLSMMQDAMDSVFNELGQKSEGVIMGSIQMTTSLIENYETIGKVLAGLIVTYGTYRTAVMLTTLATSKHTIAEIALTNARVLARKAQLALNAAMLTNPYVLLATAVVGLGTAMWAFSDSTTAAEKAQRRFNEQQKEAAKQEQEHKQRIDELVNSSRDIALSDLQRGQSLAELRKEYPKIFSQYDIESIKLADILELKRQIAEEDSKRAGERVAKGFEAANKAVSDYENTLSAKQINGGKLTQQEINKLKELHSYRDQFLVERGKGISEQFISSLKNVDISKFDEYISELEKRIKGQGENGKIKLRLPIDMKGTLSDEAIYEVKDIKSLIDTAKSTKQTRIESEKNKTTYQQDLAAAKADWEKAKKGYEAILKDQKATSEQVKNARDEMQAKEKAYKDLGGETGSSLAKQENKAKKQLEQQEQLSEQLLSLLRKNQQDEINLMEEGTEKKLAQINADFETQKQAIEKQAKELAKTNKEAGNTEINANGLTAEQQSGIDKANALNIESRKKAESEIYRIEAESMRDYLKEYGTFQQQKLAIAEEYAEKIRKAQNEGERLSLEKQRDSALLKVDVEAARQSIDWQNVFGNLGMILTEQVQPTIDNLRKITQFDEFKNASIDDQRQLFDILSQLESQSGSLGKGFSQVAQDLKLYQNSVNAYNEAYKRQAEALEKLVKAQERLKQAQQNGGDMQVEQQAVDEAKAIFDQASESVKVLGEKASENANILQASASKTKNALNGLAGNLNKLKSGSLAEAFEGIKGLGKTLGGKLGDAIANIDPTGIIGGILSIMDILKDGVSSIFVSLQDVLFGAVEGILNDVLSGDIITKTIGNTLSHVGNIWNTLTFGGFNKLFGIGGNAKEVQDSINRLTDRNEALQTSIEDLTDEIKASMGTKSVAAYRDAYKYQKEANENYKKIAQEQARYSGSHHSWNYYWNGFSQSQISDFSRKIGREWNGDIWNLTPEEMKMLRETVDMWEQIQNTGKGGYGGRLTDKLDDYIEQAGKLEELTDALYEGLTGISFDSMYDSFVSNLMDMKYDAKAAAEDISEYFMRAMLSNKIGELYSEKLEAWWKKFGASMEDNELTESERKALQDEYMGYVEEAMKLRDELAAATGYDKVAQEATSQSSTRGGYQAMSQDVGEELNGRFTALQIAGEEIKNQNAVQSQSLNLLTMKADALLFISSETRNIADETRDIMARSYLELVQISENTGNSAKYLKDIKDDIAEVKRNTSKL